MAAGFGILAALGAALTWMPVLAMMALSERSSSSESLGADGETGLLRLLSLTSRKSGPHFSFFMEEELDAGLSEEIGMKNCLYTSLTRSISVHPGCLEMRSTSQAFSIVCRGVSFLPNVSSMRLIMKPTSGRLMLSLRSVRRFASKTEVSVVGLLGFLALRGVASRAARSAGLREAELLNRI